MLHTREATGALPDPGEGRREGDAGSTPRFFDRGGRDDQDQFQRRGRTPVSRLPTARQKVRKGQSELEEGGRERREDALALKAPRLRSSEPYEQPGQLFR